MTRRSYGAGQLYVRKDSRGQETSYGRWYVGGQRIKRTVGPKRPAGSSKGLTRAHAEAELRRLVESERPVVRARLLLKGAGERYLEHLEHVLERKPTTVADYRYMLVGHLVPFFETKPIE